MPHRQTAVVMNWFREKKFGFAEALGMECFVRAQSLKQPGLREFAEKRGLDYGMEISFTMRPPEKEGQRIEAIDVELAGRTRAESAGRIIEVLQGKRAHLERQAERAAKRLSLVRRCGATIA